MEQIIEIRSFFSRYFIPYLWLHVPMVGAVAFLTAGGYLVPLILAVVLALLPTVFWLKDRTGAQTRYTSTVGALGFVAVMVYQLAGHPWQIDMHMYFFAMLAIITAWCDWRALLVAAVTAAVHHLGLNFIYPLAIFPDGANFFRVVLHAVIVVVETGVLVWLAHRLCASFIHSEEAVTLAEQAKADSERLAEEQRAEQASQQARAAKIQDILNALDADIGSNLADVKNAAGVLESTAQTLLQNTEQTTRQSESAKDASDTTVSNVENVAAASEELSASISEISRQVSGSTNIASNAVSEVDHANEKVRGLAKAANKIGEVVALITDIADQTNLLALNATIEAARAGEAGKGFAVVASEVKNLANQTARATEEISTQIGGIQNATQDAVQAIGSIGGTITNINEISAAIAAAVEQQGAATQEIANNVNLAATGTSAVASDLQSLSDVIGESKQGSQSVLEASNQLFGHSDAMRARIERFLNDVKAA